MRTRFADAHQPLLFQPVASELPFPLTQVVEQVRAVHFEDIESELEVRVADAGPLAFIRHDFMGKGSHLIVFHPVLNHPETPVEVVRFIAKHELTHIVCPGSEIGGYWEPHDDAFWEYEAAIAPERSAAWAWINKNLRRCLRDSRYGLRVSRRWRDFRDKPRSPYEPTLPFHSGRWEPFCPGDGAQLRLPASWVVGPQP